MALFASADPLDAAWVVAALPAGFLARVDPLVRCERRLLDTFDWRLHRRGMVLEYRPGRPGLVLLQPPGRDEPLTAPAARAPAGPGDLPASALREHIAAATGGRALVEVGRSRAELTAIAIVDRRGRPAARLSLEADRVRPRSRPLVRARLAPVAGGAAAGDRIAAALAEFLGPALEVDPLFAAAVAASGRGPAADPAHPRIEIRGEDPLGAALAQLMRGFAGVLEETRPGMLARVDSEFLHDFRVAVRRLRVVVAHARGVLPESRRAPLGAGLRWLGEMTGPARDSDVAIEWAAGLGTILSPDQVAALDPFTEHLGAWNARAHAELGAAVASPRYRRLIDQLGRAAEAAARARGPAARRPVGEWAAARVGRLYRRALREGGAIDDAAPAEALHGLRKIAKRLRYTLEFYREALDDAAVAPAVAALRDLQDNLGDFQDAEVQAEFVVDAAHRLAERGAPAATLLALGALAERLAERKLAARAEFARRFERFSSAKVRRRYAAIGEVGS